MRGAPRIAVAVIFLLLGGCVRSVPDAQPVHTLSLSNTLLPPSPLVVGASSSAPPTYTGPGPNPRPAGRTSAPAPKPQTTASPPRSAPVPSAAQLRAALLGPADLPGFSQDSKDESPIGSTPACPALDDDFSGSATATAGALFKKSATGPFIRERLSQLSTGRASAAVSTIAGLPRRCPSFTEDVPQLNGTVRFTVISLSTPRIGDGIAAFRLTMRPDSAPGFAVYENVLIIRRGGTIILITQTDINTIDNGLTSSSGNAAYQKTARVW
ncbi:MAG: hypothetical protein V7603_1562 [Micromonosporaceae bacterium]